MERNRSTGNIIWLSAEARNQLTREAGYLAKVLEPFPIRSDNSEEILFFMVKFDELIPRLDQYFQLEKLRKAMQDFDASSESLNLLNLLKNQLEGTIKPDHLVQILKAVTSFSWRGFKEKDNALELVVAIWKRSQELGVKDYKFENQVVSAFTNIGYPSQFIHEAQKEKNKFRVLSNAITCASQPWNSRFVEAWLLLSTQTPTMESIDIHLLEAFVKRLLKEKKLIENRFVRFKVIDVVVNILESKIHHKLWVDHLSTLLDILIDYGQEETDYLIDRMDFSSHSQSKWDDAIYTMCLERVRNIKTDWAEASLDRFRAEPPRRQKSA